MSAFFVKVFVLTVDFGIFLLAASGGSRVLYKVAVYLLLVGGVSAVAAAFAAALG